MEASTFLLLYVTTSETERVFPSSSVKVIAAFMGTMSTVKEAPALVPSANLTGSDIFPAMSLADTSKVYVWSSSAFPKRS